MEAMSSTGTFIKQSYIIILKYYLHVERASGGLGTT